MASSASAAAAQTGSQGSFAAHLSLTLYDANGVARRVEDDLTALRGAKLGKDESSVIEVQDGAGRDTTVRIRKDGSYAVLEYRLGTTLRYDSRSGAPADPATAALAARAERLAGLAVAGGTATVLTSAAPSVVAGALDRGESAQGVIVEVTDVKGVSRYVGGANGVVYGSRSAGAIALESVTVDGGVVTDSVRGVDGAGTTTVGGGALGGTTLALSRDVHGTESVAVSSSGTSADASSAVATAAVDAFGDSVTIGRDQHGDATIALVDGAGTAFTFDGAVSGTTAALTTSLAVGGASGTALVALADDVTASTTTGSTVQASNALDAVGTNKDAGGTLSLALDAQIASSVDVSDATKKTLAQATVGIHASAQGTLAVLGSAQGLVEDGYRDGNDAVRFAAGSSRAASGGTVLDDANATQIVALTASTVDKDVRSVVPPDPKKHDGGSSTTTDDATLSVEAFGHGASAWRHDVISVDKGHPHLALSDSDGPAAV
ncbi:MAG: hypothetical protein JO103_09160 [Candidatus Eremiobacteraeota bacterium]|nr:hypothetical protein [Candidatus Eremiobacteraeota bacterium]